jgi:hypothetical protein
MKSLHDSEGFRVLRSYGTRSLSRPRRREVPSGPQKHEKPSPQ